MKQKDLVLLAHLRQNSRQKLKTIAKKTNTPVSTLFDRLKQLEQKTIKQNTILIDWKTLGFTTNAVVLLKAKPGKRDELKNKLSKTAQVNTLSRINNGHDFLVELVCKDLTELEDLLEKLESDFGAKKNVHFVIEEITRENFLANPKLLTLLGGENK